MVYAMNTHAITQAGVRLISVRQLILFGVCCGTVLALVAFGAGLFVGQRISLQSDAFAALSDPAKEHFAFNRLGDMAGRLSRLEGEARSLVKKIGALEVLETRLGDLKAGRTQLIKRQLDVNKNGAAGGKVLAPLACASSNETSSPVVLKQMDQLDVSIDCIQSLLGHIDSAASLRSFAYMTVPIHLPVSAVNIGSIFGNRIDPINGQFAFHSGLDFSAPIGTPIYAAGAGTVKKAEWGGELGYCIEIDHGNGLVTRYAHTSKMYIKAGEKVTPGQLIGHVGSTGRSTGPHLHFEVLRNGQYVDPNIFLSIGSQIPNV